MRMVRVMVLVVVTALGAAGRRNYLRFQRGDQGPDREAGAGGQIAPGHPTPQHTGWRVSPPKNVTVLLKKNNVFLFVSKITQTTTSFTDISREIFE